MKCEICKVNEAETALTLERNGVQEELYVCKACANNEKHKEQKKRQQTRKIDGVPPGISVSIAQVGGKGEFPAAILDEINKVMEEAFSTIAGQVKSKETVPKKEEKKFNFSCDRVDPLFRIGDKLHLEGLYLLGELDAVKESFRALDMALNSVTADTVTDVGHVYTVSYTGAIGRATRVVKDLISQERNARVRLVQEVPRILSDSVCRSLAILKNCRLLSPAELFDLLSPLRLAAVEGKLEGMTLEEIDSEMKEIDLSSSEFNMSPSLADQIDADRADLVNKRFENVLFNERVEG